MKMNLFKIVVLMSTIIGCDQKTIRESQKQKVLAENYNGRVTKKFIDKVNHATPTVVLNDNRQISFIGNIYDAIEVNDSIVKFSGEIKMYIYRKGSKIELDNSNYYNWE